MEMTSRERLQALFSNQTPDRVGSSFLINPYYTNSLPGKPDPIEFMRGIGADIIDRDCPLPYTIRYTGGVELREEYKDGITRVIFETPVGTVWESYKGKRAWGDIPFKQESFLKEEEDYKILQYVFEHSHFEPSYEWFAERDAMIGDAGIVVPQITEFRSSLEYLCEDNVQRTVYDMMDYPDVVGSFLEVLKAKNLEACRVAVESPAEVFNIWEDSSTTLVSPSLFEEYVLPEFKAFTSIVNGAGKKLIHHACGHIKDLLPLMYTEEVYAFESITPRGTGNIDMTDLAEAWKDKFLVIGGLDPMFLIHCSMDELREKVAAVMDEMGEYKRRFIIANGDSLPPGVQPEKLQMIVEMAQAYTL